MNHLQLLQQVYPAGEARALYRMVMEECFGLSQTQLLLGKDKDLSADECKELANIIDRLLQKEPVQYILGYADFCQHRFRVEPGVLIPRPETEELVRLVAEHHPVPADMLDVGTGSGCIAVTLALEGHHVTAYDISPEALRIARGNALNLGASVDFQQVDILHADTSRQWDVIVSNPPYICRGEASEMDANVLDYEPHTALFVPDEDPLLFYRAIAHFAAGHLTRGGALYFECNRAFVHEVAQLMRTLGFSQVEGRNDMFDNPRFAIGVWL